jgi:hypothetical protein
VAGVGVFILAVETNFTKRNLILSSFLLVCAAWTRPEGLNLALGAMLLLTVLNIANQSKPFHWKEIAIFFSPLLFYVVFWQLTKAQVYPEPFRNSDLFSSALSQFKQGNFHLEAIFYILTYLTQELLNFRIFGAVGLALLLSAIFVIISRKHIPPSTWMLIIVGTLWIVMIAGMYYLLSFSSSHDLSWWVTSGLNRMIFPGIILLWLGVVMVANGISVSPEK